jgi:hypothetical protein
MHFFYPALFFSIFTFSCSGSDANPEIEKVIEIDTLVEIKFDFEKITFESLDGLSITANKYEIDSESPVIVLCHQARFNKFEYEGIAQELNELGFNCIAIDQRSGGPIANQVNETQLLAKEKGLGVDYLDARQDITAAVNYTSELYQQEIILWGSSYSSSLVLWEGLSNENVKAIVSFSPGDYFSEIGSLTDSLAGIEKPFFVTSANFEIKDTEGLLSKVELKENQIHFKPEGEGHHGSRALWKDQEGGEEYWEAITNFLNTLK